WRRECRPKRYSPIMTILKRPILMLVCSTRPDWRTSARSRSSRHEIPRRRTLPRTLVHLLNNCGHDAIHTRDLPTGNATPDSDINRISLAEERIVVSKDGDFYNSYIATKEPFKLLHIATGNISNTELLTLIERNIDLIVKSLENGQVVSVDRRYVIVVH